MSLTNACRVALVVEDNSAFATQIDTAIQTLGESWCVRIVDSGHQALTRLSAPATTVDLVLVDLGLPDMSGVDVIRAARVRFREVPVLVVSAFDNGSSVLASVQAGASGYLCKGDSVLSLADAVRRVLAGEFPISPSIARHLFHFATLPAQEPTGADGLLSPRELELLGWLSKAYTYDEAARRMEISVNTAHTFAKRIFRKLEVGSKGEALAHARGRGWVG